MSRLRALALLLLAAGSAQLGAGWYLPAKAVAAQGLLRLAWERTRVTGEPARPWPWARHWPVARLSVALHDPPQQVDEIVLAGAVGASLAFGPGHLDGTPLPGEPGNAVLAGHRDTSFAFLARLRRGDALLVETPRGERRRYVVAETRIVGKDDRGMLAPTPVPALTLITCYPFDAVWPGTPLRYVVRAVASPVVGTTGRRRRRVAGSRPCRGPTSSVCSPAPAATSPPTCCSRAGACSTSSPAS
ncbi:MAG TPA: class GN sortase [Thermoanaerobaculia bacterium]|nr:class GN sortase [Thermoanaerobaculia bacterium]